MQLLCIYAWCVCACSVYALLCALSLGVLDARCVGMYTHVCVCVCMCHAWCPCAIHAPPTHILTLAAHPTVMHARSSSGATWPFATLHTMRATFITDYRDLQQQQQVATATAAKGSSIPPCFPPRLMLPNSSTAVASRAMLNSPGSWQHYDARAGLRDMERSAADMRLYRKSLEQRAAAAATGSKHDDAHMYKAAASGSWDDDEHGQGQEASPSHGGHGGGGGGGGDMWVDDDAVAGESSSSSLSY